MMIIQGELNTGQISSYTRQPIYLSLLHFIVI